MNMTPREVLEHEHEIIFKVLESVEEEARSMKHSGAVRGERIAKRIDFIRNFADRCHHAKEENCLFARMQDRGVPCEGGPIAVMLAEHEEGRRHVRVADEALQRAEGGDRAAVSQLTESLMAYVTLLREHIKKENSVLYPLADQLLTDEDQRRLAEDFDRIEAEEMGEGVHEQYHRMAQDLVKS